MKPQCRSGVGPVKYTDEKIVVTVESDSDYAKDLVARSAFERSKYV
jgi:hypothetical protein